MHGAQDPEPTAPAYILQNTVFHSRYLPASSKHAFTYPTVALLFSLSALETHRLDLGHGRLFGYSDPGSSSVWALARITGIRPEAYLHDPNSYSNMKRKTIREKLEDVLRRYGLDSSELDDAWMTTMPSYFGIEGINPLTVFFCYRKADARLWVVVLEVHNTFGERHVYVLPTGPNHEDKDTVAGFTHSWTFPRQFHVSPFNDRSGYYTCSVSPPSYPPPCSLVASHNASKRPLPKILIQLWTPDKELKLTASLRAVSSSPLTTRDLFVTLSKYPFTLLLSFARIVWQAFHLHYQLKLDVYARPEPRAVDPATENVFAQSTDKANQEKGVVRNDVQRREDGELGVGGGIGWQREGLLERYARRTVERFLEVRARETGIEIQLSSTNPAFELKTFSPVRDPNFDVQTSPETFRRASTSLPKWRELTLIYRSSRAFLLILASPSSAYALLLARDSEQLLHVSDDQLFHDAFSLPSVYRDEEMREVPILLRLLQQVRKLPIPQDLLNLGESQDETEMKIPSVHPLDVPYFLPDHSFASDSQISLHNTLFTFLRLLVLLAFLGVTYLEKSVFALFRARFVKGTEPWGVWERAEVASARQKTKNNSAS